ncbi:hypothetical protein K469DRAFT_589916 [Zopfia rhizophila CBS 207.26]|uniref:Zn(2)-C6 fungal-type domain-containing protein n=1 Tax=Zopfia rhizophila CBS 207.26 TaxID=1314779 RepID=A0A6A6DT60_9PEZI|nr:hypothetical protein K469DRAFT_589916 [Zopfia rhizophila CBS 207.26]
MSGVGQRRQQKMAACVHCRQMKLKCDGNERFPAPCSRCNSSGLNCHVDPLFKRTAKRERLNAVERQLREIRERLDTPRTLSPQHVQQCPPIASSTATTESPKEVDPSVFQLVINNIRTKSSPRALHGVELQPDLIADLVEEFYLNYHGYFPILPDIPSFLDHTKNDILLFWTVMSIALRSKNAYRETYLLLAESVRGLACDLARSGLISLQSIQSLLLLCCWPPPFGPTMDDPSLTFVTLATSHALCLGLHRPRFVSEFEYCSNLDEPTVIHRRKTWIGCFIINYCVSSYRGIPPTVQPDQSLLEAAAAQPYWLPDSLFFQLQIARHGIYICNALGNHEMTANGLLPNPSPYLRAFDAELRLQETENSQRWPKHDFINFLGCKMILYGFGVTAYCNNSDKVKCQEVAGFANRLDSHHWTEQAYIVASVLIQTACSMKEGFLFSTVHLQRWLANAIGFLLRLTIYPQDYQFDEVAIRNGINQGWELLRNCSLRENDHISRACAVIAYLSGESCGMNPVQSHAIVRTQAKMGANMFADMVTIARDRFSQHIKDQRPKDCTGAAAVEQARTSQNDLYFDNLFSAQFTEDWDTILQSI